MSRPLLPVAMLLLAIPAAPAAGQDNPDLTGRWVLKPEAPAGADSAGAPADSGQMVADSAAAARPSSDLRPVLRPRAKPEDQQQLSRLVGMAQPVAAFRITHEKAAVTFENDDGFTYVVRPGADWDSIQVGEEYTRVRARWRERALEIEFRPPGGGRIIETYHLADSRTYLRLEVVVEHEVLAQRLWRPRMYRRDAR